MANDVRIRVTADTRDAEAKIGGLSNALSSVGAVAAGALSAQVLGAAVSGISSFIGGAIEQASNLSESINAVDVIFKDSSSTILDWGETSATAFGLSQQEFNSMATPMGAMLKNMGYSLDETAEQTINLTKRAADMASVHNTTVASALAAIQAGLRGEIDPLERYGVSLSAAAVEAHALSMTGKGLASALTDQEKSAARVALIFKQTSDVAGDFANTSGGLANSQRIADAEMKKLQATIGMQLIPAMLALTNMQMAIVQAASDYLLPVLNFLIEHFGKIVPVIGTLVTAIVIVLIPKLIALTVATWAYVAGLTAQAIGMAFVTPWLAAVGAAAAITAGATIALAIRTHTAAKAEVVLGAEAKTATVAVEKMGDTVRSTAAKIDEMTSSTLAAYIATESLKIGNEEFEESLPALIEKLREKVELEAAIKKGTDALIESITHEKAITEANKAATESASAAKRDYADAESDAISLTRDLNNMIDQQRGKVMSLAETFIDLGKSIRANAVGAFQQLTGGGMGGQAAFNASGQLAEAQLARARAQIGEAFSQGKLSSNIDPTGMTTATALFKALETGASGRAPDPIDVALGLVDKLGARIAPVNINVTGIITDPVATGQAVAAALNSASRTTGPLLLSGTVQ